MNLAVAAIDTKGITISACALEAALRILTEVAAMAGSLTFIDVIARFVIWVEPVTGMTRTNRTRWRFPADVSASSISSAAMFHAMAAFVREIGAIGASVAYTGPGDAFVGTAPEFVAPAGRRSSCANLRGGVTSRKEFIHAIAAVVVTVAEPALQNAALCSSAEELS